MLDRVVDEGRIAEREVAVDEGVAHRLDHDVDALGRVEAAIRPSDSPTER